VLAVAGRGAPAFVVPRIEAEVEVDGVLDEAAWSRAARLVGFHGYQPVDNRAAEEETEVRVWYSPTAIHFGVIARDRDPGSIRATVADRDNIDREDRVTIYLDTFDDRRRAFLFGVNALGVQRDGVRSEGQSTPGQTFGGEEDLAPDFHFDSRGRLTSEGYVVEVRIPFRSLRFPSGEPQRWGLNVTRHVQRTGHEDSWTDARRGSSSFLAQSGAMEGLRGLERGVVLEAQPFATASLSGERDPATDRFDRGGVEPSMGANLRLGLGHIAVDATINPDFSQVESDAGLVTANERFDLFVPEKRPFFLEGIELFATPGQLVYTRRIVNPDVGGKITGKLGRWGIAHLTALDDVPGPRGAGGGDALVNITRLRRDVGGNSLAGLTLTDRRVGGDHNTVAAADARIYFRDIYFVEAQLGGSSTRERGASRTGAIWSATADRTGHTYGFNYEVAGRSDGFEARSGFVPRTGVVEAHGFNRLRFYGSPGARLEEVTLFAGPSGVWAHDGFGRGAPLEGEGFVDLEVRLRGGWSLEARAARSFFHFPAEAYALREVETAPGVREPWVPAEEVSGLPGFSLDLSTPVWRRFNAGAAMSLGRVPIFEEAAEGRERRVQASLAARPAGTVRAELTLVASRLTRDRDGSEYARTIIPRLRVEYQPVRALFFRAVSEYRAERRAALRDARTGRSILIGGAPVPRFEDNGLRAEWLAAYEPTPGTAAYLGYAVDFRERDPLAFDRLRPRGDGLFVKVAYQLRR
jgi:hypothetical protein